MAAIPPDEERAAMLEVGQECFCCKCMACDFNVGTIVVEISGSFTKVAEYESATDPGYYDHEESSGAWEGSGTFSQHPPAELGPFGDLFGLFLWNTGKYRDAGTRECLCPETVTAAMFNIGEYRTPSADPWHAYGTGDYEFTVTAVEDPELVLSSGTGTHRVGVFDMDFQYDAGEGRWALTLGVNGDLGDIGDNIGPNSGSGTPYVTMLCDREAGPCDHPGGTYTGVFDDGYTEGSGPPEFVIYESEITVTVTVNGAGFRNCVEALEI